MFCNRQIKSESPISSRRLYLEGLSADYAALRKNPKASANLDKENKLWDRTNNDGLEDA